MMNRFFVLPALACVMIVIQIGGEAAVADGPGHFGNSSVWRGRWTSDATARRREHGGTLRVRLRPGPGNTYQANFAGRFAGVIPYFYRSPVVVVGNQLVATKQLGPLGEYRMRLTAGPGVLSGRWSTGSGPSSGGHAGSIYLQRRR